jgi:SAM-dependent methyltransferase
MAAELLERGYEPVGIDASEAMLERARRLLGPRSDLSRQTLPDLRVDGIFDAAISTFDGLNYLTLPAFRETLRRIATSLRHGGWLVFDLHTDAMLAMAEANPILAGDADGNAYVITNVVDTSARTCDARIQVSRDGTSFSERHLQYFHADIDVRSALADSGFTLVTVAHEYTDVPATASTLRATWVARRTMT